MKRIDIALIRAYGRDDGYKAVPFGLLDIASYLDKYGFKVKIIDRLKNKTSFLDIFKNIRYWNPRYIGIGAMTSQAEDALRLGRYVKRHLNIPLVYGGLHFTTLPEEGLHVGDMLVRGEGENALLEILNNRVNDKRIYVNEPVSNLDSIPLPKENLIKLLNWNPADFSLMTSRGCPFNCIFCLDKIHRQTKIRRHSVAYTLDLIELVKKTLDIREFTILDDIFPLDQEWVFNFCEELNKRKLNIKLRCNTHSGINNIGMYKAMKAAGFYEVGIGVESGNNHVLKAINKCQTVEKVRETIGIIKKTGLDVCAFFMIGNIKETDETIKDTVNLARELSLNGWASYAQPFPGSRFYELAEEYGILINKNAKQYYNDRISFIPHGLTYSKMKKRRNELLKIILNPRKKPLLKRAVNKIKGIIGRISK